MIPPSTGMASDLKYSSQYSGDQATRVHAFSTPHSPLHSDSLKPLIMRIEGKEQGNRTAQISYPQVPCSNCLSDTCLSSEPSHDCSVSLSQEFLAAASHESSSASSEASTNRCRNAVSPFTRLAFLLSPALRRVPSGCVPSVIVFGAHV